MVRVNLNHAGKMLVIDFQKANVQDSSQIKQCRNQPLMRQQYDFKGTARIPTIIIIESINEVKLEKPVKVVVGDSFTIYRKHQSTHMPNIGVPSGLSKEEANDARDIFDLIASENIDKNAFENQVKQTGNAVYITQRKADEIAVFPQDQHTSFLPQKTDVDNSKRFSVPPLPSFLDHLRSNCNIGCFGWMFAIGITIAITILIYSIWHKIEPWSLSNGEQIATGVVLAFLVGFICKLFDFKN
jgi:hypothetical protein